MIGKNFAVWLIWNFIFSNPTLLVGVYYIEKKQVVNWIWLTSTASQVVNQMWLTTAASQVVNQILLITWLFVYMYVQELDLKTDISERKKNVG